MNCQKYRKNPVINYPDRKWPDMEIEKAPVWVSVDLRDGNQALVEPMNVDEKMEMFELLIRLGFKEIEIGFPAASQIEFDFLRKLVDEGKIPDDVKVQVLTQCREELLDRTFESIKGIKNVIVHVYNSTSILQRDVVFHKDKKEITQIAVDGARMVKNHLNDFDGNIQLEYSPESFTGTEPEYATEICNAVIKEWDHATKVPKDSVVNWGNEPGEPIPVIINLPATVEMNTPNVYADQVEWVSRHLDDRKNVIISVHPHNDRGTGIACTELALLAGAERVEGTLLGNGERTGNIDIINVAYNMFSQGIDPQLNLEDINEIIDVFERCTKMEVDPRHPYAGKLVFTAFSGSHQDAINKGKQAMQERGTLVWQIPYLPIDPADIGRAYEPVVRINSQSGKGGVAFVMDQVYGYKFPKSMQREFADVIQNISERDGGEVKPETIMRAFRNEYLETKSPFEFIEVKIDETEEDNTHIILKFNYNGEKITTEADGNGPVDAVKLAIKQTVPELDFAIEDYTEHSLSSGSHAKAAAYIQIKDNRTGNTTHGVGVSGNITKASIRAVFSALNRMKGI